MNVNAGAVVTQAGDFEGGSDKASLGDKSARLAEGVNSQQGAEEGAEETPSSEDSLPRGWGR